MNVTLESIKNNTIDVLQLKAGELAVVVSDEYKGEIVIKVNNKIQDEVALQTLGKQYYWSEVGDLELRKLELGEKIVIS